MLSTLFKLEAKEISTSLVGCLLLILGACIKIPFYPVPVTLHTFSLFLIALMQSPKQAFYSANGYLLLATFGFPVFYLHANPYWWVGKCGGYLWAFPIAAYGMAIMRVKIGNFLALTAGAIFILLCGFIWLIPFVGLSVAWKQGLLCFIPCELAKIFVVTILIKGRQHER